MSHILATSTRPPAEYSTRYMKPPAQYSAFISYASANREKADEICASLEGRGLVCWMAPRDVRAGREYADEIILGLERSGAVVLLLSEAANTSVFVLREVERAVSKEINVVPVRIEDVTPAPGLELFISGTHWLDVWGGDWDAHMDRLVRDLGDSPAGAPIPRSFSRGRSVSERPPLRRGYVAAGLAVVLAFSGIAIWSYSDRTPQPVETPVRPDDGLVSASGPDATSSATRDQRGQGDVLPTSPVAPEPSGTRDIGAARDTGTRRRVERDNPPIPRPVAPPAGAATDTGPVALETSRALNALRDDYDDLSLRGGVIDDALNQLWEEMKPNSPRTDMVTHQRSLRMNLTRSKDALADRDAAEARRYLEIARGDLEALAQFLNR